MLLVFCPVRVRNIGVRPLLFIAEEIVRKVHRVNEARDVAMFLLRQKSGLGLKDITGRFGVKYKVISQRVWLVKKRMEKDKAFRGRVVDRK